MSYYDSFITLIFHYAYCFKLVCWFMFQWPRLQMLSYNVASNSFRGDLRPQVAPLRWGNRADAAKLLEAGQPQLVIGAARQVKVYTVYRAVALCRSI